MGLCLKGLREAVKASETEANARVASAASSARMVRGGRESGLVGG